MKFLLTILISLVGYRSVGQIKCKHVEIDSVCWAEGLKLNWNDFRGVPDSTVGTYMGVKAQASTHAEIIAQGYWDSNLPNFKVANRFIRSHSWVTDTTREIGLVHERLHFDIAELYARKMRQGIHELRKKKISDVNVYTDLINTYLGELKERNRKYDLETGHSVVDLKQQEWNLEIKRELDLLKQYATKPEDCR